MGLDYIVRHTTRSSTFQKRCKDILDRTAAKINPRLTIIHLLRRTNYSGASQTRIAWIEAEHHAPEGSGNHIPHQSHVLI